VLLVRLCCRCYDAYHGGAPKVQTITSKNLSKFGMPTKAKSKNMFFRKVILFISCILFGLTLFAQSKKEKLSEIMRTYHKYNMFDGAVLVAEKGKIIYKEAFGLANREWNIPNTTDTKFMI
jgi:hypothetical protein